MTFDFLYVWIDPIRRLGPEAMAVDEWLLEHAEAPVLRVYRWHGEWGSIGYFGSLADAKASFPVLDWVRRWTGGGTVDHRQDWTYSVVAPAVESLSIMRGDRSYRLIHAAVAEALTLEGIEARLSSGEEKTGASLCFENPVNHDLVGKGGRKLAGAGQRRTRSGLLHQGSVAAACSPEDSSARAGRLATALASAWSFKDYSPPEALIAGLLATRYARVDWTQRR